MENAFEIKHILVSIQVYLEYLENLFPTLPLSAFSYLDLNHKYFKKFNSPRAYDSPILGIKWYEIANSKLQTEKPNNYI